MRTRSAKAFKLQLLYLPFIFIAKNVINEILSLFSDFEEFLSRRYYT